MIWNNASNVIWNGSSVDSVWYNQTKIWPTSTPVPPSALHWIASGSYTTPSTATRGAPLVFQCTFFSGADSSVLRTYTTYNSQTVSSLKYGVDYKNFYLAYTARCNLTTESYLYTTSKLVVNGPAQLYTSPSANVTFSYNGWPSPSNIDMSSGMDGSAWLTASASLVNNRSYPLISWCNMSAASARFRDSVVTGTGCYASASQANVTGSLSWIASGDY